MLDPIVAASPGRQLRAVRRENVMTCTPRLPRNASVCVRASPNPEYASQPGNYAHWLLAHTLPLLIGAMDLPSADGDPPLLGVHLHIAHGSNTLLPVWAPRYAELFEVACKRGAAQLAADGSSSGPWVGLRCDAHLNVSVAAFSFCHRPWWAPQGLQRVSAYLRTRLGLPPAIQDAHARHRILVLHRRSTDGYRAFKGLERSCETGFAEDAARRGVVPARTTIECTSFNMSTPLAVMARMVGAPDALALVSGHGAGLANVIYMQPGASMAEFDSVKNLGKARNFYQYLAEGIGVRSTKVWLNASGTRFCPPRANACGAGNLNMYRASVTIPPLVLDQVFREVTEQSGHALRDCGIARDEEGFKMFHAVPRKPGWASLTMPIWVPN